MTDSCNNWTKIIRDVALDYIRRWWHLSRIGRRSWHRHYAHPWIHLIPIENEICLGSIHSKINQDEPDDIWNNRVSFTSSREETIALGTAILAALSHTRIRTITNNGNTKVCPGLIVQNIPPNAVGISLC